MTVLESRERAVLDGGSLPPYAPRLIGDCLVRAAGGNGTAGVRLIGGRTEVHRTYGELVDDASRVLAGLRATGLRPGVPILLQIPDDLDLLTAFWACLLGGFVPVPVSAVAAPGGGTSPGRLLRDVWETLDRPPVLTGGECRSAAVEQAGDVAWRIAQLGEIPYLRGHDPDRTCHRGDEDDVALMLLTSGSTGRPKAVELTHRNVLSRSAATAQVRDLGPASRSFNWMPLDHVGGLVMVHVRDVFVGADQVHAPMRWVLEDPLRWLDGVDRFRATTTWAPNFAFALVNDNAPRMTGRSWDLSCLGYVMNGGEPIRPPVVRRFLEILTPHGLPADSIHPGWGMSETSSGVVDCRLPDDGNGHDDRFVPVGRPHPGVRLRVVDDVGAVAAIGETGHLQVTGAPVTCSYHDNDDQNARSFTPDGWFRSGDLAYVSDGMVTVVGRVGEMVSIAGVDLQLGEIESAVEEIGLVEPSFTVCRLAADGAPVIFCCPRRAADHDAAARSIREHLASRFGLAAAEVTFVGIDEVPKTGVGKLCRAPVRRTS